MNALEGIILIIGLLGFMIGAIASVTLKKHVSLVKVTEIKGPSLLYSNGIPPKRVLTDEGIKIFKYYRLVFACS